MEASQRDQARHRLAAATVAVVGLGGLGAPAAVHLARAGVGRLLLFDNDVVERSNLHRQLLYRDADIGRLKVEVAAFRIRQEYPAARIDAAAERITASNAAEKLAGCDFGIDATDNLESKYALNLALVTLGTPFSHAGATGLQAQVMTIIPRHSACLRCVFPDDADDDTPVCQQAGIIGPLPGLVATIQTSEAIAWITTRQPHWADRLLQYDGRLDRWRVLRVSRDPSCPTCGN